MEAELSSKLDLSVHYVVKWGFCLFIEKKIWNRSIVVVALYFIPFLINKSTHLLTGIKQNLIILHIKKKIKGCLAGSVSKAYKS